MIGGNAAAIIQVQAVEQNEIGEDVASWEDAISCSGWLDLSTGDSNTVNFNAKIQESTHIFLCDPFPLVYQAEGKPDVKVTPENSRMIVDGEIYEVTLYDDPLGLHEHFEIYLKFLGG